MVLFTLWYDVGGSTHGPIPFKMASKMTNQDCKVVIFAEIARRLEII